MRHKQQHNQHRHRPPKWVTKVEIRKKDDTSWSNAHKFLICSINTQLMHRFKHVISLISNWSSNCLIEVKLANDETVWIIDPFIMSQIEQLDAELPPIKWCPHLDRLLILSIITATNKNDAITYAWITLNDNQTNNDLIWRAESRDDNHPVAWLDRAPR